MPKPVLIILVVLVLVAGGGLYLVTQRQAEASVGPVPEIDATVRPFTLTAHTGKPFSDTELRGKVVLLYFGFTFCPDICPTELGYVAKVMRALGPQADGVQPVFITVDPERDTVAKIAEYVPLFDKRLIGLVGTPEQTAALAKAYGVFFQKTQVVSKQPGYYLIDHTSTIFVLDRQGRIADTLDSESPVTVAAARVQRLLTTP
jgi:protein SCO1/2